MSRRLWRLSEYTRSIAQAWNETISHSLTKHRKEWGKEPSAAREKPLAEHDGTDKSLQKTTQYIPIEKQTVFIEISPKDIVDIILVALLLYYIFRLMRDSRSLNVFIGIMVFIVIWLFVSQVLEMRLLGSILDKLVSVGVLAIIVLFQEEIRKFLYSLGAHQRMATIMRFLGTKHDSEHADKKSIMPVVMACMNMARNKVGALIVIERGAPLDDIIETGDRIDALINQRLIENIFFKNSPLHDGAMIIKKKRICAAGCILPVAHDLNIPKELGLRHRAALGISQVSDAISIICSEETGRISVTMKGEFHLRLSAEKLESLLTEELAVK